MNKEITNNKEIKEEVVIKQPKGMLKEILRKMLVDINETDEDNIICTTKEVAEQIQKALEENCNEILCDSVKQFVEAVQRYLDHEITPEDIIDNEVVSVLFELNSKGVTVDFGTDFIKLRSGMCIEEIYYLGILIGEAQQKIWLETVCRETLSDKKVRK